MGLDNMIQDREQPSGFQILREMAKGAIIFPMAFPSSVIYLTERNHSNALYRVLGGLASAACLANWGKEIFDNVPWALVTATNALSLAYEAIKYKLTHPYRYLFNWVDRDFKRINELRGYGVLPRDRME